MSFRCERCGEHQPPRSKPNVVVTEWHGGGDQPRQVKKEQRICDRCAGKPVPERPAAPPAAEAPQVQETKADVAA